MVMTIISISSSSLKKEGGANYWGDAKYREYGIRPCFVHNMVLTSGQVTDPNGGFYHQGSSCHACQKWNYSKKSCQATNAAVAAMDCHKYGDKELDRKCWKKTVTPGKAINTTRKYCL